MYVENKIFLITIIFGLFFLFYNLLLYIRTRVPIIITPRNYLINLVGFFKNQNMICNSTVYEMGSGWGDFSFVIEKYNPKKIIGFELSPIHLWYSQIKSRLKKSNIKFLAEDFFEAKIEDADIIYVYLVPAVAEKLWQKIKHYSKLVKMLTNRFFCNIFILYEL